MEKTIQETSEGQLRELGQNIGNLVVDYLEKHPKGVTVDRAIAYVFKHYPYVFAFGATSSVDTRWQKDISDSFSKRNETSKRASSSNARRGSFGIGRASGL